LPVLVMGSFCDLEVWLLEEGCPGRGMKCAEEGYFGIGEGEKRGLESLGW
jgi:hypothetical protein